MSLYANFFYQVGMLQHTPRSGFAFLGSGQQSVADHTFRMLNIAFVLNRLVEVPADELHLLKLVLFHDLPEARTGDLNYENQKYVRVDEDKLFAEMEAELPFGAEIVALAREYEERKTLAARIAYEADQLEFLITVKEELDKGNALAQDWIQPCVARLKSPAAQELAQEILATRMDEWWFSNKGDKHWVNRGRQE
ncbi:MAG: HD domain-containing protein [Anaerolineae bacterium]|nr:HD domain-containing protein [Anaerolineae bacterium]